MKLNLFLLVPIVLVWISCHAKVESSSEAIAADSTTLENTTEAPVFNCYESITNQDTFRLRVEYFENKVTGTLAYLFHDKDSNVGDFEGSMHGDTLVAEYIFLSEGSSSVRQVAFLLDENMAKEGYGLMAEKDGKMFITNMRSLSFGKGVVMKKQKCPPDPKDIESVPNDLTGTWELYYITGKKITFEVLYPGKKPKLMFDAPSPTQFNGNSGCNSFQGKCHTRGTVIKFEEPMAMTKMFCEGNGEQTFLNLLKKVNIYDVNADTLTLLVDDVEVLRFSKK